MKKLYPSALGALFVFLLLMAALPAQCQWQTAPLPRLLPMNEMWVTGNKLYGINGNTLYLMQNDKWESVFHFGSKKASSNSYSRIIALGDTLFLNANNNFHRSTDNGENWLKLHQGFYYDNYWGQSDDLHMIGDTLYMLNQKVIYAMHRDDVVWRQQKLNFKTGTDNLSHLYDHSRITNRQMSFLAPGKILIRVKYEYKQYFIGVMQQVGDEWQWQYAVKGFQRFYNSQESPDSSIYIGTDRGVWEFDKASDSFRSLNFKGDSVWVNQLFMEDSILYCASGSGLFRYTGEQEWENITPEGSYPNFRCIAVYEGKLYAGNVMGTYVSENGGKHWNMIANEADSIRFSEIYTWHDRLYLNLYQEAYNKHTKENYLLFYKDSLDQDWKFQQVILPTTLRNINVSYIKNPVLRVINDTLAYLSDDYYRRELQFIFSGDSVRAQRSRFPTNNGFRCLYQQGDTLLLGTSNGKVLRSFDDGDNWHPASLGLPSVYPYKFIKKEDTLLLLSWGSIYQSTDMGTIWEYRGATDAYPYKQIGDTLYYRSSSQSGAYKIDTLTYTVDYGKSWKSLRGPQKVFASAGQHILVKGRFKISLDTGVNWQQAKAGLQEVINLKEETQWKDQTVFLAEKEGMPVIVWRNLKQLELPPPVTEWQTLLNDSVTWPEPSTIEMKWEYDNQPEDQFLLSYTNVDDLKDTLPGSQKNHNFQAFTYTVYSPEITLRVSRNGDESLPVQLRVMGRQPEILSVDSLGVGQVGVDVSFPQIEETFAFIMQLEGNNIPQEYEELKLDPDKVEEGNFVGQMVFQDLDTGTYILKVRGVKGGRMYGPWRLQRFRVNPEYIILFSEEAASMDIRCYPVPIENQLTVEVPGQVTVRQTELLNSLGQVVYSTAGSPGRVELGHLPQGWYVLRMQTGQKWVQTRILKR